jgi:hypothetical protein
MVKINRIHIFLIFILFSVLLFLIIKSIMTKDLITGSNQYEIYGNAIILMPFSTGLSIIIINVLSGAGALLVNKKRNTEIHKGFVYSLIFSLACLLAYIIFLVYIFISGSK